MSPPGRLVLTIDSGLFAMDTIFNDVCALVTAAFALTLVPGFRQPAYSLLSRRDQGTALLVFMSLGLLEEATASHAVGLTNESWRYVLADSWQVLWWDWLSVCL